MEAAVERRVNARADERVDGWGRAVDYSGDIAIVEEIEIDEDDISILIEGEND
jgi:hypothetical protein